MSSNIIANFPEAAPFVASVGTMRFQPDKPLPAALVMKIVKARIVENLEVAAERTAVKRKTAAPGKKK